MTGSGNKSLGKRARSSGGKSSIFNMESSQPKKRRKQEIEIYSKEHYETKVKPLVDAEAQKYLDSEGVPLAKGPKLKLLREMTQDVFKSEEQCVKDDITLKAHNRPKWNRSRRWYSRRRVRCRWP